jgi:hypothetical protein
VTQPIDKYYLVLAALNEQQFELISHVMDDEPSATSYKKLKEALLANNTLTPYQLVDRLVNMEPLGGRKASELLVAMQKYRPPKDEHFFAYHFLQRLPREIRVLLAREDQSDMQKLAEKAVYRLCTVCFFSALHRKPASPKANIPAGKTA